MNITIACNVIVCVILKFCMNTWEKFQIPYTRYRPVKKMKNKLTIYLLISEMPFKSLHKDLLVFIQLLGNRSPLPCNPKRPRRHENKDGNLCK